MATAPDARRQNGQSKRVARASAPVRRNKLASSAGNTGKRQDALISYEDSADTLRGYQRGLFGGTPEEKPELYRASSPITYAERVSAPALIIQGRNDTRTPARPVEIYEQKMNALGKEIEVKWFDSGHLGAALQVEQSIEFQEWMLSFASRVLGQR